MAITYETDGMNNIMMIGGQDPNVVLRDTWGDTPPGTYPIKFLITYSENGDLVFIRKIMDSVLENPFFYDHLDSFWDYVLPSVWGKKEMIEEGKVYWFTGTYTLFKNGNHRWSGKVKEVEIKNP